jgi:hypothetical protein
VPAEGEEPLEPVDLNLIVAVIHHGCMGLPQELVDRIMDMLRDNIRALKACSLTCKAMFASTRHLIHQTLYLTTRNSRSVLTQEEKSRSQIAGNYDVHLKILSCMAERGLLQYPRKVYISMPGISSPWIPQSHLQHFQSLDRVHTLTIRSDIAVWAHNHKTCFAHLYQTLTSLTLRFPLSGYQPLLHFAFQFPNLEDLCLDSRGEQIGLDWPHVYIIKRSPPLSGRLQLIGSDMVAQWPTDLVNGLADGLPNFRSVELVDLFGFDPRYLLNKCAHTLENLTIALRRIGTHCRLVL